MINIQEKKAVSQFPQVTLLMGAPKIGKSSLVAQIPDVLILDLELSGYEGIDTKAWVGISDHDELREALKYFFSAANTSYKTLVIDHLRYMTSFFAGVITKETGARFVEEVEFGKGSAQLKMMIEKEIKLIKSALAQSPDKRVIFVAHANDKNGEIRLDVDGKNESLILGLVDGVAYINRDPSTSNTMINFSARAGVEAGIRNPHLSNYSGVLAEYDRGSMSLKAKWEELFTIASGKTENKEDKQVKTKK